MGWFLMFDSIGQVHSKGEHLKLVGASIGIWGANEGQSVADIMWVDIGLLPLKLLHIYTKEVKRNKHIGVRGTNWERAGECQLYIFCIEKVICKDRENIWARGVVAGGARPTHGGLWGQLALQCCNRWPPCRIHSHKAFSSRLWFVIFPVKCHKCI